MCLNRKMHPKDDKIMHFLYANNTLVVNCHRSTLLTSLFNYILVVYYLSLSVRMILSSIIARWKRNALREFWIGWYKTSTTATQKLNLPLDLNRGLNFFKKKMTQQTNLLLIGFLVVKIYANREEKNDSLQLNCHLNILYLHYVTDWCKFS